MKAIPNSLIGARPVTIKDVARHAGLSYAQVSRALNDKYGVGAQTRTRVLKSAQALGYRPNAIARSLITRKTLTIGLIVPDLRNPFFPEVAGAIEAAAEAEGYGVFYSVSDWDPRQEDRYLSLFLERRVDGVVVSPVRRTHGVARLEVPRTVPAVYVASVPEGAHHPGVTIDNEKGARLAVAHLLDRGRRRIAFIGARDGSDSSADRFRGYRSALLDARISYDESLVRLGPFTPKGASSSVRSLFRETGRNEGDAGTPFGAAVNRPDAIFAENDVLAVAAIQTLGDLGLRVPEDVSVVGFDNIPIASLHALDLTTVAQPTEEMGRRAVELLIAQMSGRHASRLTVLEPDLVIRGTT